jgi:hypothetical protein
MFYTLTGALKATGADQLTILRAIEGGQIAAAKDLFGEWQIERAALHRVFPPLAEHGSGKNAAQGCAAPAAGATLEAEIGALIRQAGNGLRRQPDDARHATQATRGSGRESAPASPPTDQFGIAVPAALAWDHQIRAGSRDGDQRLSVMLTTGALLAALGLGWIGGSSSYHFFAPSPSHNQLTSSSARKLGSEPEAICITRLESGREATRSAPSTTKVVTPTQPTSVSPKASEVAVQHQAKSLSRSRATPTPDTRPTTLPGWTVRDVVGGAVVLEGPDGILKVTRGDTVPGLGRVDSIVRWGSRWIVATSRGLITTQ